MLNYDIYMKIRKFDSNFDFVNYCIPIIDLLSPLKYTHNRKYCNEDFLVNMLEFVIGGTKWIYYRGPPECPIGGKYLNEIHNKWCHLGVYNEINKALTKKYLSINREMKLKDQLLESTLQQIKKDPLMIFSIIIYYQIVLSNDFWLILVTVPLSIEIY